MNLIDYIKKILRNNKENPRIITKTLTKTYGTTDPLEIGLYNDKTPLPNQTINIKINGVTYPRKTDENGIARLNINLGVGEYPVYINYEETEQYNPTKAYETVYIKSNTRIEGTNINKNNTATAIYQCAIYDNNNNRLKNTPIDITVNNVTYTRTTSDDGLAKLNIRLGTGNYTITAKYNGNTLYNPSTTTNTITVTEDPKPKPKTYSQEILEYFEKKFGKVTCIDDCLEKVQNKGYGYYYDDKLSNKQTIDALATPNGVKPNCTDIHHVFWHLGKALGYDVRAVHVICKSGTGHVRLDFNKGQGWFSRDASAVADGNSITSIWCSNGTVRAINPNWFMENLNR